jgi:hypothetical protein
VSVVQLDVRRSPSLTAAIQVMATMPREAAKETRKYSKAVIVPEWKKALSDAAPPARMFQTRLVKPSTVYVTDRGVRLVSGKGALVRQTEFGGAREAYTTYRREGHRVTRRTQRQFWNYRQKGHVVYPSASEMIPRIAALWVQTIYHTVAETIERHIRG